MREAYSTGYALQYYKHATTFVQMLLEFSQGVHMSIYNKQKEELSVYEMYTLLMAGKKKYSSALHWVCELYIFYFMIVSPALL